VGSRTTGGAGAATYGEGRDTVEDLLAALEAAGAMTRASRQVLLKKMAEPVTGTPGLVDGDVVKLVKEV